MPENADCGVDGIYIIWLDVSAAPLDQAAHGLAGPAAALSVYGVTKPRCTAARLSVPARRNRTEDGGHVRGN